MRVLGLHPIPFHLQLLNYLLAHLIFLFKMSSKIYAGPLTASNTSAYRPRQRRLRDLFSTWPSPSLHSRCSPPGMPFCPPQEVWPPTEACRSYATSSKKSSLIPPRRKALSFLSTLRLTSPSYSSHSDYRLPLLFFEHTFFPNELMTAHIY